MEPNAFSDVISSEIPDWSRERIDHFWDPGKKLIRAVRKYQSAQCKTGVLWKLVAKYWVLIHWFWSLITQCEIHLNCEIGGGLILPHPTGIILHPESKVGVNCVIFHQVTLAGKVTVGGHVDIGTGAKLMGPIEIGDHVQIGSNSVVTKDVDDKSVVAGVPAIVIAQSNDD